MTIGVVLAAAGRGERLGAGAPKAFLALGGKSLLERAVTPFLAHPSVRAVAIVVGDPADPRACSLPAVVLGDPRVRLVAGGAERQDSVRAGLAALGEVDLILVHDAARPFVTRALIDAVAVAALEHGAAIPAVAVPETVKRVDDAGCVQATVPREALRLAQTPQGFRAAILRGAHAAAAASGRVATDDAALVEEMGQRVQVVPGDPHNLKITSPADLPMAEAILADAAGGNVAEKKRRAPAAARRAAARPHAVASGPAFRVGLGIDRHPFDAGRPLVLGGVTLPGVPGLEGHSDADAVLHAVADALSGAVGLPDIGTRFPGGDPRFRGAPSRTFVEAVRADLARGGWTVGNLDVVILAEVPPLAPYLAAMRTSIAAILRLPEDRIGLKAKRGERLGFVGNREGIEVHAVALVGRARAPRRATLRAARRAAGRRR